QTRVFRIEGNSSCSCESAQNCEFCVIQLDLDKLIGLLVLRQFIFNDLPRTLILAVWIRENFIRGFDSADMLLQRRKPFTHFPGINPPGTQPIFCGNVTIDNVTIYSKLTSMSHNVFKIRPPVAVRQCGSMPSQTQRNSGAPPSCYGAASYGHSYLLAP